MIKKPLIILATALLLSLSLGSGVKAATLSFDADTEIDLTDLDTALYALSGSEVDSMEVSGSTLTVDIAAGDTFTLGSGSPMHNVLRVTPAGGEVTLTLDSANLSAGYIGEWTLNSTAATSWEILFAVSDTTTTHQIDVNDVLYNRFNANGAGEVQFTYTGDFTNKTFSVATWEQVSTGGGGSSSSAQGQEQETPREEDQATPTQPTDGSSEDIEALKARVRELQLEVIRLARQLIALLQARLSQTLLLGS